MARSRSLRAEQKPEEQSLEFLRDRVYEAVKGDILRGHYKSRQRLQEASLAAQFEVSKTPVREALARLVQEGLLEVQPRIGYQVPSYSLEEVRELFDFRAILEGASAELATLNTTELEIVRLEILLAPEMIPSGDENYLAYLDWNRQFHIVLAQASGNRYLQRAIENVLSQMTHVFHYRQQFGELAERTLQEHIAVLEPLKRRDAAAARKAMEDTIESTKSEVLRALISEGYQRVP